MEWTNPTSWKLIWGVEPDSLESRSIELYHLEQDPGECNNLAASHPERAAGMLATLRQHTAQLDLTKFSDTEEEPDPEVLGRLQALGYIDGMDSATFLPVSLSLPPR